MGAPALAVGAESGRAPLGELPRGVALPRPGEALRLGAIALYPRSCSAKKSSRQEIYICIMVYTSDSISVYEYDTTVPDWYHDHAWYYQYRI